MNVLGCLVSDNLLAQWKSQFVCDPAPFFLPENLELPPETLVLKRSEFAASNFELSYRDSFATHAMSPKTEAIAFLTAAEFEALPIHVQQQVLYAQVTLGRGQIYLWEKVASYVQSCPDLAESRCVLIDGAKHLSLDIRLWNALPEDIQNRWLVDFITSDNTLHCLSSTLSEVQWSSIDNASIRALAGTFASKSGANCFSTALAAITQQPYTIADFWLHQEPFFRGLKQRGFALDPAGSVEDRELRDAILVWYNPEDKAQHTCYVIGNGFVLNKNSQAWFSPRQLLHLETLVADWKDETYQICIYRRTKQR